MSDAARSRLPQLRTGDNCTGCPVFLRVLARTDSTLPSRFRNNKTIRVSKPRRSGFREPQLTQQHRQPPRGQQGCHYSRHYRAYISYLRDAFVFYEAKRYDIKGKKYLNTQAKHYVCDSGMRYAVLGTSDMGWSRMYESAVFLELTR